MHLIPDLYPELLSGDVVVHVEKEMATHSSVLAWRISGTEEPGGLPSLGLHRVGHNLAEAAAEQTVHSSNIPEFFQMRTPKRAGCPRDTRPLGF